MKRQESVLNIVVLLALLLGPLLSLATPVTAQTPQGLVIGNSGAVTYTENAVPVAIAPNLTLTFSGGATLTQAKAEITVNFNSSEDALGILGQSITASELGILSSGTVDGLHWSYNNGVLTLTGSASAATYQSALRKIVYRNSSETPVTAQRTIRITLGSGLEYAGNGHFFEFIPNQNIRWTVANSAANSKLYFGKQGYLATILSAAEQSFVFTKLQGNGWIGANDAASEGVWQWVTGPEAGTTFWQGKGNGSTVPGLYSNWQTNQPDDANGEDYAHVIGDQGVGGTSVLGQWNDLPDLVPPQFTAYQPKGYIIEYGGLNSDPAVTLAADAYVNVVSVNDPPTNLQLSGSKTVQENLPAGTVIGAFSQTDVDGGPTFSYVLVSGDVGAFEIDQHSNILKTHQSFDFETKNSYTVGVSVRDGRGGAMTQTFTINITDQVIAPQITSGAPPAGTYKSAYGQFFEAAIGDPPVITMTVTGALPAGLSLLNPPGANNALLSGTPTQAGTFPITLTAQNGVNQATQTYNLVINKAILSAAPDHHVVKRNAPFPTLTFNYKGFKSGDGPGDLTTEPVFKAIDGGGAKIIDTSTLGVYRIITETAGVDDAYDFVYALGYLTIETKEVPDITWPDLAPITYGTALGGTQLNATAVGTDTNPLTGTFVYSPTSGTVLPAGHGELITAVFTPVDATNYAVITLTNQITVTPASLLVEAGNYNVNAGDPLPTLTPIYTTFVNGDTERNLDTPPVLTTTANLNQAGVYSVTFSRQALDNDYTITHQAGVLTVTVTAGVTVTGRPGDTFPFTAKGFAPGEVVTVTVDGQPLAVVKANPDGEVNAAVYLDPGMATGPHTVAASGPSGSASSQVNLDNGASSQPVPGGERTLITGRPAGPGSQIPLPLVGFTPGKTVTLKINGEVVGQVVADKKGNINPALLFDPNTPPGSYHLQAIGPTVTRDGYTQISAGGPVLTTPITSPKINTVAGAPGSHFPFSAGGFLPGQEVAILVDGKYVATAIPDASGNINAVIYLDGNTQPGVHTIQAGPAGPSEQVGIDGAVPPRANPGGAPTFSNTDEVGAPGGYFPFTGTGFQPGETVKLVVNGIAVGAVTADGNGKVNALLKFNGNIGEGSYPVVGTGQTSGATSTAQTTISTTAAERYNTGNLPVLEVKSVDSGIYLPIITKNSTP